MIDKFKGRSELSIFVKFLGICELEIIIEIITIIKQLNLLYLFFILYYFYFKNKNKKYYSYKKIEDFQKH